VSARGQCTPGAGKRREEATSGLSCEVAGFALVQCVRGGGEAVSRKLALSSFCSPERRPWNSCEDWVTVEPAMGEDWSMLLTVGPLWEPHASSSSFITGQRGSRPGETKSHKSNETKMLSADLT
jgi:hypothetical protein